MAATEFVTILSCDSLAIIQVARSKLEAACIPCHIANEYLVGTLWWYSGALGGVSLQVPACHAAEARELLTEDVSPETTVTEGEGEGEESAPVCPDCGSDEVEDRNLARPSVILGILLGFPLRWRRRWHRCKRCGRSWK